MIVFDTMDAPVGALLLAAGDDGLTTIRFAPHDDRPDEDRAAWRPAAGADGPAARILADARAQLGEYFGGRRTGFDLPLAPRGTPFQARVWSALRAIPFGATISYAELARRVGNGKAVRAVGGANGRNPLPIVVPCHRVIGADGSLTGFGGGLHRKQWLLAHEGARRPDPELALL